MLEPVSKLRVNRVGSAGAAGGAAKWPVHTRSCLCLPFRRCACRASAPTLWAASSFGANTTPERSGQTIQVCPLPHRRGLASKIAGRAATGSFEIGSLVKILILNKAGIGFLLLAASAFQILADSPEGTMLIDEDFEKNEIGAKPAKWYTYVDDEKELVVVDSPAIGSRAVRLNDTGPTVWKPLLSAAVSGESGNCLKLDFDWYLEKPFKDDTVFCVKMRGKGNVSIAEVRIGGKGGISVKQKGLGFVPFEIPLKFGQWNHLTLITEPISKKQSGVFSVIVRQGEEKSEFKNIQYYPPEKWQGDFPEAWEYTPCFNLESKASGSDGVVYLDNIRLQVIPQG